MTHSSRQAVQAALNFCFPEKCLSCGELGSDVWCERCRIDLKPVWGPICARCGAPSGSRLCARCRYERPCFAQVRSGYLYEGTLRRLILRFKFEGCVRLKESLGELLVPLLRAVGSGGSVMVIPVPSDPLRRWRRGFNPTELLAVSAAQSLSLCVEPKAARRRWGGPPQVGLSRAGRGVNLIGKFYIPDPTLVMGKNVVVVDDIFTTGATLSALSRALVQANARSVRAVTLARD